MRKIIILIITLFTTTCYSYGTAGKWTVYINSIVKKDKILIDNQFNVKKVEFFKDRSLSGKPYAVWDEYGLRIGVKYICITGGRLDWSFYQPHLYENVTKKNGRLTYSKEGLSHKSGFVDKRHGEKCKVIKTEGRSVKDFPGIDLGGWVTFDIDQFDGRIGSLIIEKQRVYFSIEQFGKPYVHFPVEGLLKYFWGEKEFQKIKALFDEFRDVIKSKSVQKLKMFLDKVSGERRWEDYVSLKIRKKKTLSGKDVKKFLTYTDLSKLSLFPETMYRRKKKYKKYSSLIIGNFWLEVPSLEIAKEKDDYKLYGIELR